MNQIWIFFTWSLVWTCCWSFNNRYNHNDNHQDEYDYQLDYHRPRDRQIALQLQAKAVENQGKSLLREAGDIGTQNTRSKESTNRSRPHPKYYYTNILPAFSRNAIICAMSQVKLLIVLHCCHNYLEDYVQLHTRGMILLDLRNCAPFGTMQICLKG